MRKQGKKLGSERGHSVIEVALMAPWIFFIFMAVIDIGFYCYAAINTQNAARSVALYISSIGGPVLDPANRSCGYALNELNSVPLPGGTQTTCGSVVQVQIYRVTPSPDGENAVGATVTVQTLPMIPIPGLMSQLTISRTAIMRLNGVL